MAESNRSSTLKATSESPHFRRFPADTFGLRINNNWAQLTFSLESADVEDRDLVSREATVILTLQSLKVLQLLLAGAVEGIEKQFGPVNLPAGKEEELKKVGGLFQVTPKGKAEH
jgi:hypothetical protein